MKKEEEKMISLNSEFSEFDLCKLEERLETDPLAVGGLLDLATTEDPSDASMLSDCECHCSWIAHNK